MPSRQHFDDTFPCPNCGEDVPAGALSCPGCGADEDTGWSEMTEYDDLDLPALDDDPDEPWSEDPAAGGGQTVPGWIVLTATLLILAMGFGIVRWIVRMFT